MKVYCDNIEARIHPVHQKMYSKWIRGDNDVHMEAYIQQSDIPITFSFQKVPGHADDDTLFDYDISPKHIKRNIDMYAAAHQFRINGLSHLWPTIDTLLFPVQIIGLSILNTLLIRNIQEHVHLYGRSPPMEHWMYTTLTISDKSMEIIEWQGLEVALNTLENLEQIKQAKIIHHQWPTNIILHQRTSSHKSQCIR